MNVALALSLAIPLYAFGTRVGRHRFARDTQSHVIEANTTVLAGSKCPKNRICVYLTRHGHAYHNMHSTAAKMWAYLHFFNAELSAEGVKDAIKLRDTLEKVVWSSNGRRPKPTVFYSSPLARALQTSVIAWGEHAAKVGIYPLFSARERMGWEVPDFVDAGEKAWRNRLLQELRQRGSVEISPTEVADADSEEPTTAVNYNEFLDRSKTDYEKHLEGLTKGKRKFSFKKTKPVLKREDVLKYKRIFRDVIVEPNKWPDIKELHKNEDIVTADQNQRIGLFMEDLQRIGVKLESSRSAAVIVGHSNFWLSLLQSRVVDWNAREISSELRNLGKEKMANLQTVYAEFNTEACMKPLNWRRDVGTKCPDPKCQCSDTKPWCSSVSHKCYYNPDKENYLDCGAAGYQNASPCMRIVKLEPIFRGFSE